MTSLIKNQLIYFSILYIIFMIVIKSANFTENNMMISIYGLIFILFSYAIFNLLDGTKMGLCDVPKSSTGAEKFHFEVSPEKLCDGGEYLRTSSPEKQKLCAQFSADQLANYECKPGEYHGRPVLRKGYDGNY